MKFNLYFSITILSCLALIFTSNALETSSSQGNWNSMSGNYKVIKAADGKVGCDRSISVTNLNTIVEFEKCEYGITTGEYSYVASTDSYVAYSNYYTNGDYLMYKIKYVYTILSDSMLELTEIWTNQRKNEVIHKKYYLTRKGVFCP